MKGLGKKAENLREAGIDSVEKLANSKVEDLLEIKGIGKATAEKFVSNAKDLLGDSNKDTSDGSTVESDKISAEVEADAEEEKRIQEEAKKLEEKEKEITRKKSWRRRFCTLKNDGKNPKR